MLSMSSVPKLTRAKGRSLPRGNVLSVHVVPEGRASEENSYLLERVICGRCVSASSISIGTCCSNNHTRCIRRAAGICN